MTTILYSGSMYSNKTKKLLERAEISELRKRKYKIFYPQICANGEENSIFSRSGVRHDAVPIQTVLDIYSYIDGLQDIYIDEIQFLNLNECDAENYAVEDFIKLIEYCEIHKINLYLSGLDLDFTGNAFLITKEVMPYCDKIEKLSAVCMICFNETARRSLRLKNGVPSSFDEEILIERHNVEYRYIPVCTSCFHTETKKVKKGE